MVRRTVRRALAENALKTYIKHARFKTRLRTARRAASRRLGARRSPTSTSSSLSSISSLSTLSTTSTSNSSPGDESSSSDSDWSDLLGPHWRYRRRARQSRSSIGPFEDDSSGLEEPGIRRGFDWGMSSSGSSDSSSSSSSSSSSGGDGDVEWSEMGDDVESSCSLDGTHPPLGTRVRNFVETLYEKRYHAPRTRLPRPEVPYLHHVLNVLKAERPDRFREELRVSPWTFDRLVDMISEDIVFANNSHNPQFPIEQQLAVALWRFGHHGNAAGLQKVANWSGFGKGYVLLATRRVITALTRQEVVERNIRMPTAEEKEAAKEWVEEHSCRAWREGWCLVDGTLVPLYTRPHWFGESYFDRKNNYSLNLQVVSLPNLRIIDVSYGFTGSIHDSTAWDATNLAQHHWELLEGDEFVWTDSAYPIETWVVGPYKKPERDIPDNEIFNNHVSMIRVRSEHAIGYLKGRFQSLKSLRLLIKDEASHKFATYWMLACVVAHNVAMECEAEERAEDEDVDDDPFIREGLSSSSESDDDDDEIHQHLAARESRAGIAAARARREELKRALLRARERRANRRRTTQLA